MKLVQFILIFCPLLSYSVNSNTHAPSFSKSAVSYQDEINFPTDWRTFVSTVKHKDKAGLIALCTANIHDFDGLLNMLSEPFVLQKMEESQFDDLKPVVIEEEEYLKFYAEHTRIDDFGYEYASGITLYFLKTENGLRLDAYNATG